MGEPAGGGRHRLLAPARRSAPVRVAPADGLGVGRRHPGRDGRYAAALLSLLPRRRPDLLSLSRPRHPVLRPEYAGATRPPTPESGARGAVGIRAGLVRPGGLERGYGARSLDLGAGAMGRWGGRGAGVRTFAGRLSLTATGNAKSRWPKLDLDLGYPF